LTHLLARRMAQGDERRAVDLRTDLPAPTDPPVDPPAGAFRIAGGEGVDEFGLIEAVEGCARLSAGTGPSEPQEGPAHPLVARNEAPPPRPAPGNHPPPRLAILPGDGPPHLDPHHVRLIGQGSPEQLPQAMTGLPQAAQAIEKCTRPREAGVDGGQELPGAEEAKGLDHL